MSKRINKARYWQAVLYPENMIEDWETNISDIVQVPFAYCIHDKDVDSEAEHRKDHVHLILVFSNTTTYNHALNIFKLLGVKAVNKIEACVNIRHCYDYLIHDTEACVKAGKHQYSAEERITGNNFDIGSYEQLDQATKNAMLHELVEFAVDNNICNLADFFITSMSVFGYEYFEILKSNNAFIDRICRGNYLKFVRQNEVFESKNGEFLSENTSVTDKNLHEQHKNLHEKVCPNCGSVDLQKRGKTASDQQRYLCKSCRKSFI